MKFDSVLPYDPDIAETGVWKSYKVRGRAIEFKVRYVDGLTQRGELEYKRARAPYAKQIRTGEYGDLENVVIALAHVNITDWKGIKADGKAVPYTPDVAFEFFSDEGNRWLALSLITFANEAANFALEDEFDDVEEVVKN